MRATDRMRRLIVPLAAFILGLAVLGATALVVVRPPDQESAASLVGGPFKLVTHEGRTVTEQEFVGKPYLVFFGFTHCPDVCPTTLFQISQVLQATGERGKDLRALFITADPERDTPEVLKKYLASFDDRIVGLTGEPAAVDAAVKAYRAYARKVPAGDDYSIEHTSVVYLMDRKGRFVRTFSLNRPPEEAARDLLEQI